MRDIIIALIVFGALPFVLKRPSVGIVLWCWLSYMNPHRMTYGFAYNFPFAAIVAGAVILGVLFSKESRRIPWTPLSVVWLVFILWMSFTTLFAMVPDLAHDAWSRAMKIQLMTFLTIAIMGTRERLTALVWIIVFSIGFFGVKGGIFTILTHGEDMVFGPPDTFIEGNNSIALALVMILPLMRFLQMNSQRRLVRYALGVAMALSVLAALASYSRGAFLAVTAMGMFLVWKSRKKAALILVALLIVPIMLSFMPEKWFERVETIQTYDQDKSTLGRFNAWEFAYNIAKERPLVGGGFDVFDPNLFRRYAPEPENFHDAHSIYFEVLGEHGFIGLILFLIIGFLSLKTCQWTIRETRNHDDLRWAGDLASMVQVAIIGYAVGGAFLGLAYFDLYYHLITMALLTRIYVEKALAEDRAPALKSEAAPASQGLSGRAG
jgi:probable O-glycosylation ligase (exosortase A-associated)